MFCLLSSTRGDEKAPKRLIKSSEISSGKVEKVAVIAAESRTIATVFRRFFFSRRYKRTKPAIPLFAAGSRNKKVARRCKKNLQTVLTPFRALIYHFCLSTAKSKPIKEKFNCSALLCVFRYLRILNCAHHPDELTFIFRVFAVFDSNLSCRSEQFILCDVRRFAVRLLFHACRGFNLLKSFRKIDTSAGPSGMRVWDNRSTLHSSPIDELKRVESRLSCFFVLWENVLASSRVEWNFVSLVRLRLNACSDKIFSCSIKACVLGPIQIFSASASLFWRRWKSTRHMRAERNTKVLRNKFTSLLRSGMLFRAAFRL